MALTSDSPTRANIRIEIKNDFTESMDEEMVEESGELSEGEVEDGEISDAKNTETMKNETRNKIFIPRSVAPSRSENQWHNGDGGFTTGVDIFGKDEQEKLQTRAQRFGLDPTESKSMTDDQLLELHTSLGITDSDQVDTRFEAIHMYGTEEMSTQDIFSYFGKYGPASIEWLNDTSCNVVWHDKISAARAFIALSKPIVGMPISGECDPFKDKDEDSESKLFNKGRSILLVRTEEEMDQDKENDRISRIEGAVHVSDINLPIPPGYWRIGFPHEKSEHILLRFAKRTDKKPFRAERFSEYYKKHGNPNYGGMVGLISESKKKRIKELNLEDINEEPVVQKGNPWGSLAKNWNRDVQEPEIPTRIDPEDEPIVKIKMPYQTGPSKALMDRIGESQKRVHSDKEEEEEKPKKSKVPRMRMYADEEEARIRKAKERKQIRVLEEIEEEILHKQKSKIPDLRSRLGRKDLKEERRKLEIRRPINYKKPEPIVTRSSSENSDDEEEIRVQQRSKVAVVVRKPHRPAVASTVWSRLDMEREKQKQIRIKRESSDSERRHKSSDSGSEDDSDSDEEYDKKYKKTLSKTVGERPGFKTADLKSRLGFQNTEHKSPLRIEINNDHYKKEKA